MSETIKVIPVAIWTGDAWLEADRRTWPKGSAPRYVITELDPALGVAMVGREVLSAHAMEELEAARAGDFGDDEREAFLVIGIVAR